jgi:hypothetical protein
MPARSRLLVLVALLSACGPSDGRDNPPPPKPVVAEAAVTPPRLINRDEVIRYRDTAARELLPKGDSVTIKVYVRVDAEGLVHQPEVKDEVADKRLLGAAVSVTQMMRFEPAQQDGHPTSVLLTIPVRFVNQPE